MTNVETNPDAYILTSVALREQEQDPDRSEVIEILAEHNAVAADMDEFYKTMYEYQPEEFDEKELRREYYKCELERLADLTDVELMVEWEAYEEPAITIKDKATLVKLAVDAAYETMSMRDLEHYYKNCQTEWLMTEPMGEIIGFAEHHLGSINLVFDTDEA